MGTRRAQETLTWVHPCCVFLTTVHQIIRSIILPSLELPTKDNNRGKWSRVCCVPGVCKVNESWTTEVASSILEEVNFTGSVFPDRVQIWRISAAECGQGFWVRGGVGRLLRPSLLCAPSPSPLPHHVSAATASTAADDPQCLGGPRYRARGTQGADLLAGTVGWKGGIRHQDSAGPSVPRHTLRPAARGPPTVRTARNLATSVLGRCS
ncbi:hypothetical protein J6590_050053 [Homalodisca vitripennis]|nr:hypothetical protein J6590_050053 [Homalodisca vitripennis]